MGMTIAEKIIAAAAGVPEVKPGDIHTVTLDRLMSNDGTTHLTVDMYRNKLNHPHIADPKKLVFIVDHNVPSDSPKTAASQKKMRDFARENSIDFWEGKGVCHQVMIENYVRPGELIFGADSHTCSYGALGAFGTGVGCTDFLYGMVTGTSWVLVPESVKFNLVGKLPEGVYARDLILTIIGEVGANGRDFRHHPIAVTDGRDLAHRVHRQIIGTFQGRRIVEDHRFIGRADLFQHPPDDLPARLRVGEKDQFAHDKNSIE